MRMRRKGCILNILEVESERQCGSETVEAGMTLNSGLGTWVLKVWFPEGKKKKRERVRIGVKKDDLP